ncbi:apolipoprotein Eb [Pholidichthys leucotaenia]
MKAVALILALAVMTGCNARAVRQADASPHSWEETVNRFWQSIDGLNTRTGEMVQGLKVSELNSNLNTLITKTQTELDTYTADIQRRVSSYTQASTGQLFEDLNLLTSRLMKDMVDAKERSTEYLGELKVTVEQNADDVHNRINSYTNKLRKRLSKDTQEIHKTVATYIGEVQSRATQNLETMKDHVEQTGDTTSKKLIEISSMLHTQAEGLGKQLESQAEVIKTQLEETAQELRTSLEGKIDELTQMLTPYATKVREELEKVVEKIKESTTS